MEDVRKSLSDVEVLLAELKEKCQDISYQMWLLGLDGFGLKFQESTFLAISAAREQIKEKKRKLISEAIE